MSHQFHIDINTNIKIKICIWFDFNANKSGEKSERRRGSECLERKCKEKEETWKRREGAGVF